MQKTTNIKLHQLQKIAVKLNAMQKNHCKSTITGQNKARNEWNKLRKKKEKIRKIFGD
jgi:hypothetical protein